MAYSTGLTSPSQTGVCGVSDVAGPTAARERRREQTMVASGRNGSLSPAGSASALDQARVHSLGRTLIDKIDPAPWRNKQVALPPEDAV